MGREYQAYADYKYSGCEFFCEIPAHWTLKRIKETANLINGYPFDSKRFESGKGTPLVRIRDINSSITEVGFVGEVPSDSLINSGDLLIGMDGDFNVSLWLGGVAALNQRVACIRASDEYLQKFIYYVLPFKMKVVNELTYYTTVKHLSSIDILKSSYPTPPKLELINIVNFLDHETAKIDTLIAKQQQLIALLQEKRQAVISHAVTKGLNPNAPMRDSGVEWLGEVPAHWRVSKFNYEIDFLEGPGILAYDFFEEGVPLLRIQNVKEQFVTDDYKTFLSPTKVKDKWDHFRVKLGDLIISCSASTGLVSEVDSSSVGAVPYTGLIRLRPLTKRITKDYIFFIVQSDMFFEQINNLQTGSTMQHFGPYHLQQMYITLPSLDEQKNLVRHIKRVVADIDRLIEKAQQAVELIQERRTALISAAVTGKIDVRDWTFP